MLADVEAAIGGLREAGATSTSRSWTAGVSATSASIRTASSSCAMPPTTWESGTWTCRVRPATTPYNMTHVCPTALVFCPCEKGITHNEAENVAKEDAVPSVNVLLHAVLARANR